MSRLPRDLEHLKTGFTAEAASAASYRAYAEQAEEEGLTNLARRWRAMAEDKDALAVLQLRASGRVLDEERNLLAALAEDRFETEVLYPKLIGMAGESATEVFERVLAAQREHLDRLERLRRDLVASSGDLASADDDPPAATATTESGDSE